MKKGALIGIVCGIVVMVMAVIAACAAVVLNTPSARVVRGMTKLFAEAADRGRVFGDKLDLGKILEIGADGKYKSNCSMNMDIEGLDGVAVGVNGTVLCDSEKEKMKEEISVSLAYYELLSVQLAVDKTDVYIDVPVLYDGSIVFDSQNFGEQYNHSALAGYLGEELDDDFSLNFFNQETYEVVDNTKELLNLIKSAEIKKDGSSVSVDVGNREVSCNGYAIILKKQDVNRFLENSVQNGTNAYQVENDIQLTVYMDKRNTIRQMEVEEVGINGANEKVSAAFQLSGEKHSADAIKGKMEFVENGDTLEIDFEYNSTLEGNHYLQALKGKVKTEETDLASIDYAGMWNTENAGFDVEIEINMADMNYEIDVAGSVDTEGYGYGIKFDEGTLYRSGEKVAGFDGTYSREPLTEEITIPTGTTYEIFEFSDIEFYAFIFRCYEKLEDYMDQLGGLRNLF